jgi:NAD(P)-dependent dehydrogenase (short-subunit alcohol dehydrogenase family)
MFGVGPSRMPIRSEREGGHVSVRSRAVLITGCTSGIGAAVALRLHRAGYPVYAGGRRPAALQPLVDEGITGLTLDVTDEASMRTAVERVISEHGAVGTLVNNAGFGVPGVLEEASPTAMRAQFETNVFGALRLIQLVLPGMRAQHWGRIVNISSILGRAAPPGGGIYHATKHAIEGLSDALRLEAAPFGVRTVLVQPGPVRTHFGVAAAGALTGDLPEYAEFRDHLTAWYGAVFGPGRPSGLGRFALGPDDVAATVERVIRAARPRARYPVGLVAHAFLALRRTLPDRAFDSFVKAQFPTPRSAR